MIEPTTDEAAFAEAVEVLDAGGLVVAPTDTVYAVLARVEDAGAVGRLFAARGAPSTAPPVVLVHNPRTIEAYAEISDPVLRLMAAHWPGPVTLLVRALPSLSWSLGANAGALAVRMPAEPVLLRLLDACGPLASSGAVRAGSPPATTIEQARLALGTTVGCYLDEGPRSGRPSTVVDLTTAPPQVVRPGPVAVDLSPFSPPPPDDAAGGGAEPAEAAGEPLPPGGPAREPEAGGG